MGASTFRQFRLALAAVVLLLSAPPGDGQKAPDGLRQNESLVEGSTLVSGNNRFVVGFYSLPSSVASRRYLALKYVRVPDMVWIANRDSPITASGTASLNLTADSSLGLYLGGSLLLLLWKSTTTNAVSLQLLDTGNLVVKDVTAGTMLWQSFDHPSDSLLPTMKIRLDQRLPCDGSKVGFLEMKGLKLPETLNATVDRKMSLADCASTCRNDCGCTAYALGNSTGMGIGCIRWYDDLLDMRKMGNIELDVLYLKIIDSEFKGKDKGRYTPIPIPTRKMLLMRIVENVTIPAGLAGGAIAGIVCIALVGFLAYLCWKQNKECGSGRNLEMDMTMEEVNREDLGKGKAKA